MRFFRYKPLIGQRPAKLERWSGSLDDRSGCACTLKRATTRPRIRPPGWPCDNEVMASVNQAPRLYRGISPSERRAQRRERLLEAGLQLFGTDGYADSSIRAVCTQASLNSRYF